MYLNLRKELIRKGLRYEDVAHDLGIHKNTFANKVSGKVDFSLREAVRLHEKYFAEIDFLELYKKE